MIAILLAAGLALGIGLVVTPLAIRTFRSQGLGQLIQADLPDSHQTKRGTPTMGGAVMILAAGLGYLAVHPLTGMAFSAQGIMVMVTTAALGLVGFVDDFLKIRNQRSLGLTKTAKLTGQALGAVILALGAWYWVQRPAVFTGLSFIRPIDGTAMPLVLFVVWIFLLVAAASNAVNLTDGMDGLASGTTVLVMSAYVVIAFWQFRHSCFTDALPGCYSVREGQALDLAVSAAALMGATAGFLWWNAPPARIFMGDTGSLALGGSLAALALFTNTQLLLFVLGGLYVVETLSVILQIASFRLLHRRIFRMAPIHLHFELSQWPEFTVIVRFWILAGLAVAFGLGLFYAEFIAQGGTSG